MKKIAILLSLIVALLANIVLQTQIARAETSLTAPTVATVTFIYVVKSGDSLSIIAARYGVTLNAIVQANRLTRWTIYPGQQLTIPASVAAPVVAAQPVTPSKNKSIYISLSQQRMYVYENGQQIYNFVVSTGQVGRETLPGNFRVKTRLAQAWGAPWRIIMPNWLGIYDVGRFENGIHAVPIRENGEKMWENTMGQPASFGCVVLRTADAEILYRWADLGTPVIIRR